MFQFQIKEFPKIHHRNLILQIINKKNNNNNNLVNTYFHFH